MQDLLNQVIAPFSYVLWGHIMFPGGMTANVILAFSGLAFLKLYSTAVKTNRSTLKMLAFWMYLLYLPNSLYLFFEVKHLLLLTDGIADDMTKAAVLFFSMVSILGLYLTVITINETINRMSFFKKFPLLSISLLSFLSSLGALLGFYDFTSTMGLFLPPLILRNIEVLLGSGLMIRVFLVTGLLLSTLCIPIYNIFYKKKGL